MPTFERAKEQIASELLAGAALTSDQIGLAIVQAIEEFEVERFWFTEGSVTVELNEGVATYSETAPDPALGYMIGIDSLTVRKRSQRIIDPTLEQNVTLVYNNGPSSWVVGATAQATLTATGGGVAWDEWHTVTLAQDDVYLFTLRGGPSDIWVRFSATSRGGSAGTTRYYAGPVIGASEVLWNGTDDLGFFVIPTGSTFTEFTEAERSLLRANDEEVRSLLRGSQNNDGTYTNGAPEFWARFGTRVLLYPAPDAEYQARAIGHQKFDLPSDEINHSPWLEEGWYLVKARAKYNICRSVTLDDQMATRAFEEEQRAMEALRRRASRRDATNFVQPFTV